MRGGSVSNISLWGGETLCCKRLTCEELSFFGRLLAKLLQGSELGRGVGRPPPQGLRVPGDFSDLRGEALHLRAFSGGGRFESLRFAQDGWAMARETSPTAPVVSRLESFEVRRRTKSLGDKPLLDHEEACLPQQFRDLWPVFVRDFRCGREFCKILKILQIFIDYL